ncbi:MAG TPA: cytochrome c [Ferrovibrio sp.]|jgi:mono/diheme cytochrome c family protein|uniref:c-type cytochrome n=1 Tax=Ferrovibrio sp. TaxID=1917215 RepID=UPI002ED3A4F7
MRDGKQVEHGLTTNRHSVKSVVAVTVCTTLLALAGLSSLTGFLIIRAGLYNVATTAPHGSAVYWLLHTTMRQSVKHRADGIAVPNGRGKNLAEGAGLFQDNCRRCHGAPGIAPDSFALGMMPAPPNLVQTAREWSPGEIYWTIRNGVKMTGMPGWQFRLDDAQIWSLVAFISCLPKISPEDYRSGTANANGRGKDAWVSLCR